MRSAYFRVGFVRSIRDYIVRKMKTVGPPLLAIDMELIRAKIMDKKIVLIQFDTGICLCIDSIAVLVVRGSTPVEINQTSIDFRVAPLRPITNPTCQCIVNAAVDQSVVIPTDIHTLGIIV